MLMPHQIEELIVLVGAMDRPALVRQFGEFRAGFPLDFTPEFLRSASLDRLPLPDDDPRVSAADAVRALRRRTCQRRPGPRRPPRGAGDSRWGWCLPQPGWRPDDLRPRRR